MGKISFSLDADQEAFVNERLAKGQYGDAGDYFRELVRRDQEHQQASAHLGQMLDDADARGVCEDTPEAIWAEAEANEQKLNDLRLAIREGIESGASKRTVEQIWDQARQRHRSKHG